jgi:hypothetical protein
MCFHGSGSASMRDGMASIVEYLTSPVAGEKKAVAAQRSSA